MANGTSSEGTALSYLTVNKRRSYCHEFSRIFAAEISAADLAFLIS